MKSFKALLSESSKVYSYRLKTVVKLDDVKMEDMERLLRRFNLLDITSPKKINNKDDSLEFRDIENADVYYIDFTVSVPMSAYILQQELRGVLNLPEKFLVVRADNEPVEVHSGRNQMLRALDAKAKDAGFSQKGSLLSIDSEYLDAEQPIVKDVFGDKYNSKFLNLLAQVAEKRKNQTFQTSSDLNPVKDMQSMVREPSQDTQDFNAHMKGVKPVYKTTNMDEPVEFNMLAPDGNFDDDTKQYFRVSKDAQGNKKVEVMHTDPVRKLGKTKK